MELLDMKTFEGWMRRVIERLDRQEELIASLTDKRQKPEEDVKLLDGEHLLDNQDLWMLRHKTYYKEAEVLRFIATHCRIFHKEEVERYKARISKLP